MNDIPVQSEHGRRQIAVFGARPDQILPDRRPAVTVRPQPARCVCQIDGTSAMVQRRNRGVVESFAPIPWAPASLPRPADRGVSGRYHDRAPRRDHHGLPRRCLRPLCHGESPVQISWCRSSAGAVGIVCGYTSAGFAGFGERERVPRVSDRCHLAGMRS